MSHILAIDQGTTSSRAIVFDAAMAMRTVAQEEFPQHFPQSGWVEHDPDDIWSSVAATCRGAIERAGIGPGDIAAIGITNQRETTLVWERGDRPAARAGDRLAGPPHQRDLRRRCAPAGTRRRSRRRPGFCLTPTSPAPSSGGSSMRTRGRGSGRGGASSCSGRSTAI